jgi:hypothetical protein
VRYVALGMSGDGPRLRFNPIIFSKTTRFRPGGGAAAVVEWKRFVFIRKMDFGPSTTRNHPDGPELKIKESSTREHEECRSRYFF